MISVSCGRDHAICVTASGDALGWGWGEGGRLGLGDLGVVSMPSRMPMKNGTKFVSVSCGREHTILISTAQQLYSCGIGDDGRLGHGNEKSVLFPEVISAPIIDEASFIAVAGRLTTYNNFDTNFTYSW